MKNNVNYREIVRPLFDLYNLQMTPASDDSLKAFKERATSHDVPTEVIEELSNYYAMVGGTPWIHKCDDVIVFEWWNEGELWLGQRDLYTLRWTNNRYCIGDAGNVSFSPSDEHETLGSALNQFVRMYDPE